MSSINLLRNCTLDKKLSGVLLGKYFRGLNGSHVFKIPTGFKNYPNAMRSTVDFSYGSNIKNFKGNNLLSVEQLGYISLSNTYCTQISPRRKNMVNDSTDPTEKEDDYVEMNSKDIINLFPIPASTLTNIYQNVRNEKGNLGTLTKIFQSIERKWVCKYHIKWPLEKSFSITDTSKQRASSKCALMILQFLLENNYIDKNGNPIIYNKEDIRALVKDNIPVLNLNENHIERLNEMSNLYTRQILPIIEKSKTSSEFPNMIKSLRKEELPHEPVFLGYNKYMCKEDLLLPISDYKNEIIQKVKNNRVVIIKGETGCGKSTRLPQYILEGWAKEAEETGSGCNIVVTEPRRIAAISLAERVASERSEKVGKVVGYKVRFKSEFQRQTGRIMYCTNGILLQQFKSDPNLSNYTHVIIDEAHERDINTDLLLNMLKDVLKQNPALKLIIMSATINTELFQKYFESSCLIHIPGFTYPVRSHFIDEIDLNLKKTNEMCNESEPTVVREDVVKLLLHIHKNKPEGAILCFLPGWEDIKKVKELIPYRHDIMTLCLHSRLQDSEQWKIFNRAPEGVRKIILATNIAETSVTINDIGYVVDTGIHKETTFDIRKGSMCIDNHWISKSNVEQRKGRAGRVKEGDCYHMYPKSKLETLPQFPIPEILRVSLTKVVLDTKALNSNKMAIDFFNNLPSPPRAETVELAINELIDLELLDSDENLTPLGHVLHHFQLEPKLAKALVNSVIFKCVSPVVDIVTLFSAGTEMFTSGLERKEDIRRVKSKISKSSDHISLMKIFEIWNRFRNDGNDKKAEDFVYQLGLVPSKMYFLNALKEMHFNYIQDGLKQNVLPISDCFSDEDEMIKAVLFSSLGTVLSHKNWDIVKGRLKKTNVFLTRMNQKANVTPDSVNFKRIPQKDQFLLYVNETRSNMRRITLIRETTLIHAIMVLLFSNKEFIMKDVDPKNLSSKLESEEQVMIRLGNSSISFLMDKEQALKIMEARLAISSVYDHYIFQLTSGGNKDPELDASWNKLLELLNNLLNNFRNE